MATKRARQKKDLEVHQQWADNVYAHSVPTLTNLQKRTDRIYKLTQALVEMRPSRRRGDVAAVKRMTRELEILRAAQVRSRTTNS